jgi:hypothetical protein
VSWAPACLQASPPCGGASRLLDAQVWATHRGSTTTVAETHTYQYGQFRLTLAPGSYTVDAKPDDPSYPSCSPVSVEVTAGQYAYAGINCQMR